MGILLYLRRKKRIAMKKRHRALCLVATMMMFPVCLSAAARGDSCEIQGDTLASIGVVAPFQKERPINRLVYSSGRSFSTEDAYRYAGALGDVGRMVRSYAGVACPDDSRNDISIRGNSPSQLLWRIDGYEIANPNHYGSIGLTGSSVSLLNTNLIDNSDFLTGAFPAEYGNALSGVFDLHLRQVGDDYRFRFQTGWNGFELGGEGPIAPAQGSGIGRGTFQMSYRYSFLDVMEKLGLNRGLNPKYQDFTLKLQQPLSQLWKLDALALWGTSLLETMQNGTQLRTGSSTHFAGMGLHYDDQAGQKLSLRAYINRSHCHSSLSQEAARLYDENNLETRYTLAGKWEGRPGARLLLQAGAGADAYDLRFFSRRAWLWLGHAYAQGEYRFSDTWKASLGLRWQGKHLENHRHGKWEPRAALQWRINDRHRLALAYGRHHQTQVHTLYLYQDAANAGLDFARADHYCLSYDWQLTPHWRLKADAYYQALQDLAVQSDTLSSFSVHNLGSDFYIPLKAPLCNGGLARNYGIETSLEKFLHNNWYAMLNVNLFRSLYTGSDGIWRSSAYDVRYILNLVGGYQWQLSKRSLFGIDLKATTSGGRPTTPLGGEAYSAVYPPYFRSDLRLFYQFKPGSWFYEFAIDFQNWTNHKNLLYEVYNSESRLYTYYYQTLFSPMYTFRILF